MLNVGLICPVKGGTTNTNFAIEMLLWVLFNA
jgi:hypothetical protein